MKYKLIEKWLGLKVKIYRFDNLKTIIDYAYISPDELEAKLAEGFEVYASINKDYVPNWLSDSTICENTHVGLVIGKQPIKKKTREEAALELLEKIVKDPAYYSSLAKAEAKEILEMK